MENMDMTENRGKTEYSDREEWKGPAAVRDEDGGNAGGGDGESRETADPSVLEKGVPEDGTDEEEYEKVCFVCRRPREFDS